jgi:hypothetical protein
MKTTTKSPVNQYIENGQIISVYAYRGKKFNQKSTNKNVEFKTNSTHITLKGK